MTARLCSTPSSQDGRAEEVSITHLLRRVAASDRTAFVMLYDAMSGQVRGQALAALSWGDAVDAVVADTFLRVWWLAPLYDPDDTDVPAWIIAIAADRITDRLRNVPAPSGADADTRADADSQQRSPWSVLSSAYDETLTVVLAGLLGRRGPQKAF